MSESIKRRTGAMSVNSDSIELRKLYEALLADNAAQKVVIDLLVADMELRVSDHNTLATKLNSDAGVTDEDYAASTAQTSSASGALTLVS